MTVKQEQEKEVLFQAALSWRFISFLDKVQTFSIKLLGPAVSVEYFSLCEDLKGQNLPVTLLCSCFKTQPQNDLVTAKLCLLTR